MDLSLIARLNKEFSQASSQRHLIQKDSCEQLNETQRMAWSQILSSAATAEGEEENMVRPLKEFFATNPDLKDYIEFHAQDEHRHAQLLRDYIFKTFHYTKKKRTITDRIVYDFLFQKIKALASHRPLPFLTTLYFYELYAEEFYSQLKKQSEHFKMPHLFELFSVIQKDELRHIAGLKALIQIWQQKKWPVSRMDLALTKLLMMIVRFDVNTSWWAFYNKKLRRNMMALGLDPQFFYQEANRHAKNSYEKFRELRG